MKWRYWTSAIALGFALAACGEGEGSGPESVLQCDGDSVACGGACADTATDPRHCGECDVACESGSVCSDGQCIPNCPAELAACDGSCVSLSDSNRHCGACNNACAGGSVCDEGVCRNECPSGQAVCDDGCHSLETSRDHCGGCGIRCAPGELCMDGSCTAEGCTDGDCATECADGLLRCDGSCRDPGADRMHCGGCGLACGSDELCVDGSCELFCADGLLACDDLCRDTAIDRQNCGGCGLACPDGNICSEGQCVPGCNPFASTLCGDSCTNTDLDPANCGGCGNACDPGEVCSEGACAGTCADTLAMCDEGCTELANDPDNCGSCDVACPVALNASAVCMGGTCGNVCLADYEDCNADIASSGGDGCESMIATDVGNCGACGNECPVPENAVPSCVAGSCGVVCEPGFGNCDLDAANGCEVDQSSDTANCGGCGVACMSGMQCIDGMCADPAPGENCVTPLTIVGGTNILPVVATEADYLVGTQSCNSSNVTPRGPDVVLDYFALTTGDVGLYFDKPENNRWIAMVSAGSCGSPLFSPHACLTESAAPTMGGTFPVVAGTSYFVYVAAGTPGSAPLSDPLVVQVTEFDCPSFTASPTRLMPANGNTAASRYARFEADFAAPILESGVTVTLSGTLGTNLSFTLPHSAVTVTGRRMIIDPRIPFPPGEVVTLSWTGVADAHCNKPVPVPTWSITIPTPPCMPGTGGLAGSTMTHLATGAAGSLRPTYVTPDTNPAGWVYVGATTELYRSPKSGGSLEFVHTATGFTPGTLGYGLLVDGPNIYTLKGKTSGSTGHIFRISSDGGTTWQAQDMGAFPSPTANDFRGAAAYGGRIFLITNRNTVSSGMNEGPRTPTEIWSIDPNAASLPTLAHLETLFDTNAYGSCTGLAVDSSNFYAACLRTEGVESYVVVRVDRQSGQLTELADDLPGNTTAMTLYARDEGGDGIADFLYFSGGSAERYHLCGPSGTPFVDAHFKLPLESTPGGPPVGQGPNLGAHAGFGYDPVGNSLWTFDTSTIEFVKID